MKKICRLVLSTPGGQEQVFELEQAQFTIGRDAVSDIVLQDAQASRAHAKLLVNDDGITLVDLGSANGLMLNGEPVVRADMTPGDIVVLGESTLRFEAGNVSDDAEIVAINSAQELDATLVQATVPMMMVNTQAPRLTIHTPIRTWEMPLSQETLTIGRHGDCDLILDQHQVSRRHAQVERIGEGFRIRDLGSTNGTWLGAQKIEERNLADAEVIRIGNARLVFKSGFSADDLTMVAQPLDGAPLRRRPVVFLPGIMGSELWRGNERLWPNTRLLFTQPEALKFRDGDPVEARNIIGDVVIVPNLVRLQRYGRMGDFLEEALGYRRGEDLLEFAYDWRQDSRHSAQRLAAAIDYWQAPPPITIIAHSGGCLVARYYVEHLGGREKVERLILVGGPQIGCPRGVSNLFSGPDILPFGLLGQRVHEALATFPSMYQLLPAYPCVTDQSGRPIDVYADERWLPADQHRLLRDARTFRRELGMRSSVSTTSIFGYGQKTITGIRVQRDHNGQWKEADLEMDQGGDATVPTASAVLEGTEIHPVQQHHGSLYVDNDVKMRLKWELTRP